MGILSKARRNQKGSVALEVGFTLVLLFALIFLVIDLSMLVFIKSTLQQAVRDGVRVGITSRLVGSATYRSDSIIQTVQSHALGFLNGSEGACRIQITYVDPNTGVTSGGTQGDVLVVSVNNYNYTPLAALLKSADPLAISVSASDIVERCPLTGCPGDNPSPAPCP